MSRAATLLRGREDPGRVTFLELFFDLVFVFAVFRLSQGLLETTALERRLQTLVLALALWWVWGNTAVFAVPRLRDDPAAVRVSFVDDKTLVLA